MLDYIKEKKKILIIIIGVILVILYFAYTSRTEMMNTEENLEIEQSDETSDNKDEEIIVHVSGAVKNPGIVKLKEGSRIEDAIESAGGLKDDADISNINLAYIIEDGVKLRIPTKNEQYEDYIVEENGENILISDNSEESSDGSSSSKYININKASEAELETLPGIGPSLASRIISYRDENGKFKKIEDIKNVSGIGDSKFENIKDLISVK